MRIWIFDHYAEPPDGQATREYDLSRELVRRGHDVRIFAAGFDHYKRREVRLTAGESWKEEVIGGVRFVWIRTTPYAVNNWRRVLNMFSFAVAVLCVGLRHSQRPDLILAHSLHPLTGLAAALVAWLRRARFFFSVGDLWPLTLIEYGRISRANPVAWALSLMELLLFWRAERVFTVWKDVHKYVSARGFPREKTVWIPPPVDMTRYDRFPTYEGRHGTGFTVMYAGGMVVSNALDTVLQAAKALESEGAPGLRFVFVGDGTDRARLEAMTRDLGLRTVTFFGSVPKQRLPEVLRDADAFVLALHEMPMYEYGITWNKLADYLAMGRPVLLAGRSTYNPMEEARAGITVPPGDAAALAKAIRSMMALPGEELQAMARNARRYAEEVHSVTRLVDKLEACFRRPAG